MGLTSDVYLAFCLPAADTKCHSDLSRLSLQVLRHPLRGLTIWDRLWSGKDRWHIPWDFYTYILLHTAQKKTLLAAIVDPEECLQASHHSEHSSRAQAPLNIKPSACNSGWARYRSVLDSLLALKQVFRFCFLFTLEFISVAVDLNFWLPSGSNYSRLVARDIGE